MMSQDQHFQYIQAAGMPTIDRNTKKKPAKPASKDARAERLAENLRANLKRRKDAARDRTSGKDNPGDE
jgi:hypothetical protein